MLKLNYIIIGKLPEEQKKCLLDNLNEEGMKEWNGSLLKAGRGAEQQASGAAERTTVGQKNPIIIKKLNESLIEKYAEECILISGDAGELREAEHAGMAALAYLPAQGGTDAQANVDAAESLGGMEAMVQPGGMDTLSYEPTPPADMYAEGFEEIGLTFLQHVYERHHHIPWTILTTERCIVKEFSMEYLDDLFVLYEGEGMTDYMEPLFPYEQEKEYQQAYIESMYGFYGYGMWIVCEKETGNLIGRVGVEHREEFGGELELGYAIGVPYQRQGYATEVCGEVLCYVAEDLGFSEVICLIEKGNVISEHLAEKLGFSYRQTLEVDGKKMRKYLRKL